jgi:hypothetical protein
MSVDQLIGQLRRTGTTVWVEDGQLRYRGPAEITQLPAFAELRARKTEVISFLAERPQEAATPSTQALPPVFAGQRPALLPLALTQDRFFDLDHVQGLVKEHLSMEILIRGQLETGVLEKALTEIVRRHEMLRTRYQVVDGRPYQVIDPQPRIFLHRIDLAGTPAGARPAVTSDLARSYALEPFDLLSGPVIRFRLLEFAPHERVLVVTANHIAVDQASWGIFLFELNLLCQVLSAGRPSMLTPLPFQFADYALWEQEQLFKGRLESLQSYWEDRLLGLPPLELPTDRPRTGPHSQEGLLDVDFGASLAATVRSQARALGATVPIFLLAAYAVMLGRWSRQDRVMFGCVLNGRIPAVERLIGVFIRIRPFCIDLTEDPTFQACLGAARTSYAEGGDIRHPTSMALAAKYNLYRVLANFWKSNDPPQGGAEDRPFEISRYRTGLRLKERVREDLHFHIQETPTALRGQISYCADWFDRSAIERFAAGFTTFLARAADEPTRRVSELCNDLY